MEKTLCTCLLVSSTAHMYSIRIANMLGTLVILYIESFQGYGGLVEVRSQT